MIKKMMYILTGQKRRDTRELLLDIMLDCKQEVDRTYEIKRCFEKMEKDLSAINLSRKCNLGTDGYDDRIAFYSNMINRIKKLI